MNSIKRNIPGMMTKKNDKHIKTTFFQVKSLQEKLDRITTIAKEYFEKKSPLLIRVPNKEALEYINELLWKYPQDSFLPHVVKDTTCDDFITICESDRNPNKASSIFNLTNDAISSSSFNKIYELEDTSSTQKNILAQKKYRLYKEMGFTIVSI